MSLAAQVQAPRRLGLMPNQPSGGPVARVLGTVQVVRRLLRDPRTGADPAEERRIGGQRYQEVATEVCRLSGVEVELMGRPPRQPCFIVCNHRGYLDPLILGLLGPVTALAKAEVRAWPMVGAAASQMGAIFVRREDPMSGAMALRDAARRYQSGVSVVNFPEGTTYAGPGMGPFKRGIFGIARRLEAPVLPVYLELPPALSWVGDQAFLPHYLRFVARPRTPVRLWIGRPIPTHRAMSPAALMAEARGAMETLERLAT